MGKHFIDFWAIVWLSISDKIILRMSISSDIILNNCKGD